MKKIDIQKNLICQHKKLVKLLLECKNEMSIRDTLRKLEDIRTLGKKYGLICARDLYTGKVTLVRG